MSRGEEGERWGKTQTAMFPGPAGADTDIKAEALRVIECLEPQLHALSPYSS